MTPALVVLALAIVLGCRHLLGNRQPRHRALKVACRAGLTQKAGLALVTVSGRSLLVGYGEGAPALLLELEPEEAAGGKTVPVMQHECPQHEEVRCGHRIALPDRFRALLGEALGGSTLASREKMNPARSTPGARHESSRSEEAAS
ncbi:MAG: flagellar biosynthetic protein FliO [Myxococcota bacterium]